MNSQKEENEHTPAIAEYLSASRWKHALFTKYVLSLSYFESEVLRPLLQQGCDDIWLICDAQGYRSSLTTRRLSNGSLAGLGRRILGNRARANKS